MRPVLLDIEGFASFREATKIDFTDADYFALVGPTGAGKSTVIDALVFALYGTAPRWERANAIQYALAPNATRAVVRLVFDVGNRRYQIAREVRRTTQGVQQRSAMLEEFEDPPGVSDKVLPIASELRQLKAAVEGLLGLSYEDFTQAVVLPQGKFSDFLKATPDNRQAILLKLLGADQYERVRRAAATKQQEATLRATMLENQLVDLQDATEAAQIEATSRVTRLDELDKQLGERLTARAELAAAAGQAATEQSKLEDQRRLLDGVTPPDGLTDLTDRLTAAEQMLAERSEAEEAADIEWEAAQAALEAAGSKAELERLAELWLQAAGLRTELPGLEEQATETAAQATEAREQRQRADLAWQSARDASRQAELDLTSATAEVSAASARRGSLARVQPPDDLAELAAQIAAAESRAQLAEAELTQAEGALARTQQGLVGRADEEAAQEILRARDEMERLAAGLAELDSKVADARKTDETARSMLDAAREHLASSRQELRRHEREALAIDLRGQLQVGEACPVCTNTINRLPAATGHSHALAAATESFEGAETALADADQAARESERELSKWTALAHQQQQSIDDLAARATDSAVAAAQETLTQADAARSELDVAQQHAGEARNERNLAHDAAAQLGAKSAAAWRTYRSTEAEMLKLGAPADDSGQLQDAWQTLMDWITDEIRQLDDDEHPRLRRSEAANLAAQAARDEAATAESLFKAADAASNDAQQAQAVAAGRAKVAAERLREIDGLLNGQPDQPTVAARLVVLGEAEEAERQAKAAHQKAREATKRARDAQQTLRGEADTARSALRTARDTLVPLGVPALDDQDLARGWSVLTEWVAVRSQTLDGEVEAARESAAAASETLARAETELLVTAAGGGIEVARPVDVPAALAKAQTEARLALQGVEERIKRRSGLERQHGSALESGQVAALLAESLRANKFQKWLAGAALDLLVESASNTLHELSNGQYGLTHENGEFFVIDHEDAEAKRSVRTLSGGETFQASLALALALSEQLSSLSSSRASLESLFLDEGFGTLDAESLEIVAVTLERLAQGERMVGVVTHVASLADRVPTRFVVTRDSASSRVVREG